jgi:predicted dehydrogenase
VVVFGRTAQRLAEFAEPFGFATTTDLDVLVTDASVDLVDICLPTRLHAETAVRAMQAGKDVLIELPLADTLADAYRIVEVQRETGRWAFVDMFSRFSPSNRHLRKVVADQRYGQLRVLEIEARTALLWEGYDLGLQTLALDMMHADFDLVTDLLGRPQTVHVAGTEGPAGRGSAVHRPRPEHLTETTADGEHPIDLPGTSPYEAMIDHVLACLTGRADNIIEPASALAALELTLDVHDRLTQPAA